ncbi:hypothetical protein [Pseudoduganella sp. GCM10020061]|uniref:hypothetical protein n=1 Tax=Pseudoduganella sp. GCM10020061 TaxID=3317345 RepID=UPI003633A152
MKSQMICLLLGLCAGCSTTPNYDARFGDSIRMTRSAMIANADAPIDRDPVVGVDNQAARESFTRYLNTFKEPPPIVNVINIGGAVGGGASK